MPSITPMMSPILVEAVLIASMVLTTRPTTLPPSVATAEALIASALAVRALSAFCCTVPVSSSIDDAVSSSEPACGSVRRDSSRLPRAISDEPWAMSSAPSRTWRTSEASLSRIACSACSRLSWLSSRAGISTARSPSAMRPAIQLASRGSQPSWRSRSRTSRNAPPLPSTSAATPSAISRRRACAYAARDSCDSRSMCADCSSTSCDSDLTNSCSDRRMVALSRLLASVSWPSLSRWNSSIWLAASLLLALTMSARLPCSPGSFKLAVKPASRAALRLRSGSICLATAFSPWYSAAMMALRSSWWITATLYLISVASPTLRYWSCRMVSTRRCMSAMATSDTPMQASSSNMVRPKPSDRRRPIFKFPSAAAARRYWAFMRSSTVRGWSWPVSCNVLVSASLGCSFQYAATRTRAPVIFAQSLIISRRARHCPRPLRSRQSRVELSDGLVVHLLAAHQIAFVPGGHFRELDDLGVGPADRASVEVVADFIDRRERDLRPPARDHFEHLQHVARRFHVLRLHARDLDVQVIAVDVAVLQQHRDPAVGQHGLDRQVGGRLEGDVGQARPRGILRHGMGEFGELLALPGLVPADRADFFPIVLEAL